jgi:hypothetical protein
MWSAASVLACALSVLGRSESSMPPIELIDTVPQDVSVNAEAFVRRDTRTIYVITSSVMFRAAAATRRDECSYADAMRKLASVLAHEEWHVKHGPDEKAAYEYQLITLIKLGIPPGTGMYRDVQRSMLTVLKARKRDRPERMLASR